MPKSILFVDDEKPILKSIKRMFIDSQYKIYLSESGEEALKILEMKSVDLIVTDMRMPEMNGYELLSKVIKLYPKTIRVILSGYAEEDLIFKALKDNLAKAYFLKPWTDGDLRRSIDEMFNTQEMLENKNLLNVVNSLNKIPTLPDLYMKVNKLIEENANIEKISSIIEQDPAISIKVLQVANCAYFGAKTGSVKKAIMNLGLFNIRNIVLTTGVFELMNISSVERELLWAHSSMTNEIMIKIYKCLLNKKLPDSDASAGLMHDIGKIFLLKSFPKKYEVIFNDVENRKISYSDAEKESLNVSHDEIGAYLLNWWGIPNSIVEAALYHHKPLESSEVYRELVCVTHIADFYSLKILNVKNYTVLDESAFEYVGINMSDVELLIEDIETEVKQFETK